MENVIFENVIPGKHTSVFSIKSGQYLRVIDVVGAQTTDFICFNKDELREKIDPLRTLIHNNFTTRITKGDKINSNIGGIMFEIIEDTCGVHDLFFTECDVGVYRDFFKYRTNAPSGEYDGCFESFAAALKEYGITKYDIPATWNIFMHTEFNPETKRYSIELPTSKAGDFVELKAMMNLLVAINVCPCDVTPCDGGKATPIKVQIIEK
jgi:uncharacterized protein YcgI (DUF1989 family)